MLFLHIIYKGHSSMNLGIKLNLLMPFVQTTVKMSALQVCLSQLCS